MASTSSLPRRLRPALESVAVAQERKEKALRYLGKDVRRAWAGGTREHGLQGNTVGALADRGLVEVKVAKKPYKRLVCRLTDAGREALERS